MTSELSAGQAARDKALEQVARNADIAWRNAASQVIYDLTLVKHRFTTDDIWARLAQMDVETHEPRAMGAVVKQAMKDGLIAPSEDYQMSMRAACHSRPVRVWISLQRREHW